MNTEGNQETLRKDFFPPPKESDYDTLKDENPENKEQSASDEEELAQDILIVNRKDDFNSSKTDDFNSSKTDDLNSSTTIKDTKKRKDDEEDDAPVPFYDELGNAIIFNGVEVSKLTKTQMKKYKRMLKWESIKKEKRVKERLKSKKRKIEAKLNNVDLGPSRKKLKQRTMANSSCKIGVVVDLSFDELMISKDMGKVIKQILRIYTENRRSDTPMQLYLTNFEGRAKEEMEKHNGYEHWDINFHPESYLDLFPKEKLIYLSSESDNIITNLEDDKIYIIGGLVDHNSHKGVCHQKAISEGIRHGQLPISEFFQMKHRKVFTINQVFEILLRVVEGKSFKDAFEMVLPKRINMQPTAKSSELKENSQS